MLRISILIGTDKFEIEGAAVFADAKSLVEQWFTERNADQQVHIDAITAKLAAANARLGSVVEDTQPT